VMHSFGSVIDSEAFRDLGEGDREATGKTGGVIRCVFIGILLPHLGKAMYETYLNVMSAPDLDPDFEVEQDLSVRVGIAPISQRLRRWGMLLGRLLERWWLDCRRKCGLLGEDTTAEFSQIKGIASNKLHSHVLLPTQVSLISQIHAS
jgi:hypothetical protein